MQLNYLKHTHTRHCEERLLLRVTSQISSRNSKNELATKQSPFVKPLTRVFHIASKNLISSSVEQGDCFAARVELNQVYSTNSTEARNDDMEACNLS